MELELQHYLVSVVAILAVWLFFSGSAVEAPKEEPVKKEAPPAPVAPVSPPRQKSTAAAAVVPKEEVAVPKVKAAPTSPVREVKPVDINLEDFDDGPKKAPKKKSSKKKSPRAATKAIPAPINIADVTEDTPESDSEGEGAIRQVETTEKPRRENDQDATLGVSSSQDQMFEDAAWNVVEKAPRTKKQAKAEKTAAVSPKESPKPLPRNDIVTKAQQHHNQTAVHDQVVHDNERAREAAAEAAAALPVIESIVKKIQIESKKVGIVVGSKGVTLKAIQEATECEIRILKDKEDDSAEFADVTISGEIEKNVNLAAKSVLEMATKGYCLLLKGENFSEGSISVPSSSIGEIVGKGGSTLRNIQDAFDVKITTPQGNVDHKSDAPLKVGVVGDKLAVKKAKECIKHLIQWHHTLATHPGYVHAEMPLEADVHKYIIGHKGSEIHHIQKNYQVLVKIPNATTIYEGVLIVGEQENVIKASAYITKTIEKAIEKSAQYKQEREDKYAAATEQREQARAAEEQAEMEPWMRTYVKDPRTSNVLDMDAFPAMS